MAFVFAKFNFRVTKGIFFLVIAGMMIPIHTTLIPIYSMSIKAGVYDTLFALIGPYVSFNIPVSVFIMTQFFKEMPKELDEAAKIDGGSLFFDLSQDCDAALWSCNLYCWSIYLPDHVE